MPPGIALGVPLRFWPSAFPLWPTFFSNRYHGSGDNTLASGVYVRDKSSAMEIARKIQAGQCYIQGSYFNLDAPFGGFKRSGNGREWGSHAMNEYVEIKAVIA